MATRHQPGAGRIFKNPVLEALTKTHIAIPLTLFWSVGVITLWYSIAKLGIHWSTALVFFLGGIVLFTFVEYAMHRYLYHIPAETEKRKRFQYVIHGVHHDHPRDKSRLAMPPLLQHRIGRVVHQPFRLTIGENGYAFGGASSSAAAHTCLRIMPSICTSSPKLLRASWKHYNLHHFVGDDGAFGVSTPLRDCLRLMPKSRRLGGAEVNLL